MYNAHLDFRGQICEKKVRINYTQVNTVILHATSGNCTVYQLFEIIIVTVCKIAEVLFAKESKTRRFESVVITTLT